jgi:hypothetical protein
VMKRLANVASRRAIVVARTIHRNFKANIGVSRRNSGSA